MTLKINYHFDCEAIALNYILAKKRRKYRLIYVLCASRNQLCQEREETNLEEVNIGF